VGDSYCTVADAPRLHFVARHSIHLQLSRRKIENSAPRLRV
jgi:hypothetical protein